MAAITRWKRRSGTISNVFDDPWTAGYTKPRMVVNWRFFPDNLHLQEEIARRHRLSHLAARVLVNRGVRSADEAAGMLEPGLSAVTDPFRMSHMERAVQRVLDALKARQHIAVYGDSDVDGVCGTALLAGFLKAVGGNVSTYIPNRIEEGYSLTERGLAELRRRGTRLVLTVDNGTSAVERVAELQADGIDVIVNDHHEPGDRVPNAFALLNPKWEGCGYPFRYLCGTAVAYQLVAALATRLTVRGGGREVMGLLVRHSIALVALATICDCVPLIGENRIFARAGTQALCSTTHPGLRALLAIAGVGSKVQPDDISFRIGPRINAAGRLGRADEALALLLADSDDEVKAMAKVLDGHNQARQDIEAAILADARRQAQDQICAEHPVLVLADEAWHPGVVGIVASRIAAEFQRPTILIGLRGDSGRGSGRSIKGFDLHRALSRCSGHLKAFGGHAFAAGLEIDAAAIPAFREALALVAREHWVDDDDLDIWIDAEVHLGALTPSLMSELERLAPFGEGHAGPTFVVPDVKLGGALRVVGRNQSHLSFPVLQSGVVRKAIAYGMAGQAERLESVESFSLAFTPRLNLFRGRADVDLEIKDIRVREGA